MRTFGVFPISRACAVLAKVCPAAKHLQRPHGIVIGSLCAIKSQFIYFLCHMRLHGGMDMGWCMMQATILLIKAWPLRRRTAELDVRPADQSLTLTTEIETVSFCTVCVGLTVVAVLLAHALALTFQAGAGEALLALAARPAHLNAQHLDPVHHRVTVGRAAGAAGLVFGVRVVAQRKCADCRQRLKKCIR